MTIIAHTSKGKHPVFVPNNYANDLQQNRYGDNYLWALYTIDKYMSKEYPYERIKYIEFPNGYYLKWEEYC